MLVHRHRPQRAANQTGTALRGSADCALHNQSLLRVRTCPKPPPGACCPSVLAMRSGPGGCNSELPNGRLQTHLSFPHRTGLCGVGVPFGGTHGTRHGGLEYWPSGLEIPEFD